MIGINDDLIFHTWEFYSVICDTNQLMDHGLVVPLIK